MSGFGARRRHKDTDDEQHSGATWEHESNWARD